ncbi:hypothetical protein BUY96_11095, partial [Staphylococcus gallinarum]
LDGIYYYNPSLKSIMSTSNLLRKDLGLPKIKDKDDFLNKRVKDFYGTLVPQTEIDKSLLRKNQNDSSDDNDNQQDSTSTEQNNSTESPDSTQDNTSQQYDSSQDQSNSQQSDVDQQQDANQQQQNDVNQQQAPSTEPSQQAPTGDVPTNQY